jgi:hypothetical protein
MLLEITHNVCRHPPFAFGKQGFSERGDGRIMKV